FRSERRDEDAARQRHRGNRVAQPHARRAAAAPVHALLGERRCVEARERSEGGTRQSESAREVRMFVLGKASLWSRAAMLALASTWSVAHGEGPQVAAKPLQKAVTLESLPLAVREAIGRESQGAPTGQIMALPRGAATVYRFEYVLNGKHQSVVVAAD